MDVSTKKIYVYGIGRVQRDFEYIFDNLFVEGYLVDEEIDVETWAGKKVYHLTEYEKNDDNLIVICDFQFQIIAQKLEKNGYKRGTEFVILDDLLEKLDFPLEEKAKGREILVWGTGYQATVFLNEKKYSDIVSACVDNNVFSDRGLFKGKKVLHPTEIKKEEWKNYYIIVATDAYFDIREQLISYGLKEKDDFVWKNYIWLKPSEMLRKTIYDRAQYDVVCDTMLNTYEVEATGDVCCCCTTFMEERLGNLIYSEFDEIWNSNIHKVLCLSALNKTYSFCKKDMCPVLMKKKKYEYVEDYKPKKYRAFKKRPKVMLISIDSTCNLYCESCRECVCALSGQGLEKANIMAKKLLADDNLENTELLVMAGNGEVFLSKIYEKIWSNEKTKNIKRFRLLSNGTLFNEKRWGDFSEGRKSEVVVTFSIDAATGDTYKQLRRGGNFEILMKNLEFASQLRKTGKLGYFQISFVVQRKNFKEMPLFVELGKKLGVDKVFFTRILNWGTYSEEEFAKVSMTDEEGKANEELEKILELPIMKEKIVDLGTINSKKNEKEYDYIDNYYIWEIERYLNGRNY